MASDLTEAKVCPTCGAHNTEHVARCWLCGIELGEAIVLAEVVPESAPGPAVSYTLQTILGAITLIAVGLGLGDVAPGISGLIFMIGLPALIATSVRTSRRRRRGEATTWAESIGAFFVSAAIIFGVIVALCVAACVALFAWCMVAISSGSF